MPLSVVMVSAGFHPYIGGAEKQALELSAALRQRGLDVRVATRRLSGLAKRETVRGVPVVRLFCAGTGILNAVTFMASLFLFLVRESRSYQAIHAHLAGSPALTAALAGRLLGKRVVIKLGGGRGIGELAASSRTLSGRLKLFILARLKPQFVVVTRDLMEELKAYGLGEAPVKLLPNGVDTERYRPVSAGEKLALRRKWGWPSGLCFLYVGRFSPEKRLPYFLEKWSEAFRDIPGAFVALIGSGPEEKAIRTAAGRVLLLPPTDEINSAYAAADIFVLPSISEGLSNALLEAMASGLGVLASRVGGTAEVVRDGQEGLLFAPEDSGELRDKLGRLAENPGLAAQMGRRARQMALDKYAIGRVAQGYEELYRG